MSTKFHTFAVMRKDSFKWRVKARVVSMWRGVSKTGEHFKGFNLLLLDEKVCITRLQIFMKITHFMKNAISY